jgi:hypothetical protein
MKGPTSPVQLPPTQRHEIPATPTLVTQNLGQSPELGSPTQHLGSPIRLFLPAHDRIPLDPKLNVATLPPTHLGLEMEKDPGKGDFEESDIEDEEEEDDDGEESDDDSLNSDRNTDPNYGGTITQLGCVTALTNSNGDITESKKKVVSKGVKTKQPIIYITNTKACNARYKLEKLAIGKRIAKLGVQTRCYSMFYMRLYTPFHSNFSFIKRRS